MKALGFFLVTGVLGAVFFGCATSRTPEVRKDLRAILHHYNTQAYGQCLLEIERALQTKLVKGQRALLLMTRGLCQEEMGNKEAAKATYTLIKTEFDLTSIAESAQRRLEGKEGDQREHIELELKDAGWRRAVKQWNRKGVKRYFFPSGESPKHHTIRLLLLSVDRPENVKTLEDAADRAEADYDLRGGIAKHRLLERNDNEGYWEVGQWAPQRKEASVALVRLILTDDRLHCAQFTLRKPALTAEDREQFLSLLRNAKLIGDK